MVIFKIGPYLRTAARRAKITSISTLWGRKTYATSGTFFKFQVSCPNVAIWLPNLKTLVVLPLFYTKNWHTDLEFACKFCFLVDVEPLRMTHTSSVFHTDISDPKSAQ